MNPVQIELEFEYMRSACMANPDDIPFPHSPVENHTLGVDRNILSVDDLHYVLDAANNFGLTLNVLEPTSRQIQLAATGRTSACLRENLFHWLQSGQSITIQALCSSVEHQEIGAKLYR